MEEGEGGRDGEGWRKGGWGGMEKRGMEKGGMEKGGMGRDGVVWSEGGRGNRAHSPELIIACVLAHVIVVTCVFIVACVHSWALAAIHEPRWPFWLVICVHRGLWAMVKGASPLVGRGWWGVILHGEVGGRRGWWWL